MSEAITGFAGAFVGAFLGNAAVTLWYWRKRAR